MNIYVATILAGVTGTLTMDLMSIVLWKVGIFKGPLKPNVIGRWFLAMMRFTFRHRTIANYPAQRFELPFGILCHYSIGVTLAFAFLGLSRLIGFSPDAVAVAIGFGMFTNVLPWFVLFPSYGFGLFGLRGKGLLLSSTVNHLNYGIGLGLCFMAVL